MTDKKELSLDEELKDVAAGNSWNEDWGEEEPTEPGWHPSPDIHHDPGQKWEEWIDE